MLNYEESGIKHAVDKYQKRLKRFLFIRFYLFILVLRCTKEATMS